MHILVLLLLLVGVVVIALYLPRRISKQLLVFGFLFLLGAAHVLVFGLVRKAHWGRWIVLFFLLDSAVVLVAWAIKRRLRQAPPGAGIGWAMSDFAAKADGWCRSSFGGAFSSACPSAGVLKDLLAERLPFREQARLVAHLEGCAACQHRVEGLTAGQKSWPGLARNLSQQPPSPEPALQKVIDRLKGENAQEETHDEPVFSADLPLGFLSPPDKPEQLGRLERYEVLAEVGRGGMGIVLKAFDPSLHRVVAIKVLAPQLATSGVARKRFLREAKAAAAVSHDHIVTIHAVDEANGLPYLVMQYVAGQSLQERIDKDGPLELAEILRIGMQTASGLAAAHGQGIVHRDIKPANILLEDGVQRVKITDFGLARAMDDASLTQSGFVAGSPLYMAPEQARGETLDHRADLFSLGSVLYTMCTGRPPFRAANTLAVLRRVSEDVPRPIRETNPEIPDWLADVVAKLMAKDPAERFQSAAEVVEVLGPHLAQLQHAAWVPPASSPAPAGANANAGLPTSVTICPSCGASLHVGESMVGSLVHCPECGKPFHVEDGSEVIQVARAVPPPFGPRCRRRRRIPHGVLIAGGCAACLLLFILCAGVFYSIRQARTARKTPMTASGKNPIGQAQNLTIGGSVPGASASSWKNTLTWLPAEATLFGAIDFKPFGSLTLDDPRTQTFVRLVAPGETADRLTPEILGRVRIDGVALAYYEDPKTAEDREIIHLEGLALDGHKRIIDGLRRLTSEDIRVVEDDKKAMTSKPIHVSSPKLPFALGLYEDDHVFLARSMKPDSKESQHRKALEQVSWFDFSNRQRSSKDFLLSGYHPPWIKAALREVPSDACGFFLGEIPAERRKLLCETLKLRACPRSFVLHLKRTGGGIALSLSLNVDKSGADPALRDDLENWRRRAVADLQAQFPQTRKEPKALAQLAQTLNGMAWRAERGSVRTEVIIPDATWKALDTLLKRASQQH